MQTSTRHGGKDRRNGKRIRRWRRPGPGVDGRTRRDVRRQAGGCSRRAAVETRTGKRQGNRQRVFSGDIGNIHGAITSSWHRGFKHAGKGLAGSVERGIEIDAGADDVTTAAALLALRMRNRIEKAGSDQRRDAVLHGAARQSATRAQWCRRWRSSASPDCPGRERRRPSRRDASRRCPESPAARRRSCDADT